MKKALLLLLYFLSPILLVVVLFQANPQKYANTQLLFTMILGAFGYTWFIWQFILSARPKVIESAFGMDRIYRFHGLMAIVAIIASVIHKTVNEELFGESFMTRLGSIALLIFITISVITLILMTTPTLLNRLKVIKWIKKIIQTIKFIKYEFLRMIHNITFVAMIVLFFHVLNTTGAKTNLLIFTTYTVYFIIAVLFYLYHKIFKYFLMSDYAFTVQNIIKESPNMWTIEFAEKNGKKIKYQPGQFGFFSFKSDAVVEEEHPFSISSGNTKDHMSITIKELGDYTRQISHLKVGDKVYVDAPYGKFSYMNHQHEKELVFIAGGVGITPMISMLRHMQVFDKQRKVTLLWGMNQISDYIIKDEIDAMLREMPNLKVIPIVANDSSYAGERGYIDFEKMQRLLAEQIKNPSSIGFYLCGPAILMDSGIANLKKLGINEKHIHFERFSL